MDIYSDRDARRYGPRGDEDPDDPIDESTPLYTMDEISDDSSPSTPRGQGKYRYKEWIPEPVQRVGKATARWAKGPDPPRIHNIKPLFPSIQEAPIRLLDQY